MNADHDTGNPTDLPGRAPRPGDTVNGYLLEKTLGEGGQSWAFRARRGADAPVTIKFMRPPGPGEHAGDEARRARFAREFDTLRVLAPHPGIVQALGFDGAHDPPYVVLEHLAHSALDLLRDHPQGLPLASALRIAADAAEALEYAHAHEVGVLHRDIKPANILLDGIDKPAKLADFGSSHAVGLHRITPSGDHLATCRYCAPEYQRAVDASVHTDIYSLGVTLAELLRGPLLDANHGSLLASLAARPGLPEAVLRCVRRATAPNPAERHAGAAELAAELRALADAPATTPAAPTALGPPAAIGPADPIRVRRAEIPGADIYEVHLLDFPEATVIHARKLGPALATDPDALARLALPPGLGGRRHLGLILSGAMPLWWHVAMGHLAHTFAWVATYDPRLGGAVVTARHTPRAPALGTVWPLHDPEKHLAAAPADARPGPGAP